MCPSAPRVCSEPGGQKPVLSLLLDLIGSTGSNTMLRWNNYIFPYLYWRHLCRLLAPAGLKLRPHWHCTLPDRIGIHIECGRTLCWPNSAIEAKRRKTAPVPVWMQQLIPFNHIFAWLQCSAMLDWIHCECAFPADRRCNDNNCQYYVKRMLQCSSFWHNNHVITSSGWGWVWTPWPVTVKTFGLLLDKAGIWFDFPDFKHDYIKEVYRSDVYFVVCGMVNFTVTVGLAAISDSGPNLGPRGSNRSFQETRDRGCVPVKKIGSRDSIFSLVYLFLATNSTYFFF